MASNAGALRAPSVSAAIRSSADSSRAIGAAISFSSASPVVFIPFRPVDTRFKLVHDPRSSMNQTQGPRQDSSSLYPTVIIHSLNQAEAALRPGIAVALLSAPGAALAGGCMWWRAMVDQARRRWPGTPCIDILDCADSAGMAMAALRCGQLNLVLSPDCPGLSAVTRSATAFGAKVLQSRPQGIDLSLRGAAMTWMNHFENSDT